MELDSATDTVKEERSPVEGTDDSCLFQYFEVVPLARDTVSGDLCGEVKQENSAVVKQEPDDVCCLVYVTHIIM